MEVKLCKACGKNQVGKGRSVCDPCKKARRRKASREYQKRAYVKPEDAVMIQRPKRPTTYTPPMTEAEQERFNIAIDIAAGERMALSAMSPVGLRYMRGALI